MAIPVKCFLAYGVNSCRVFDSNIARSVRKTYNSRNVMWESDRISYDGNTITEGSCI